MFTICKIEFDLFELHWLTHVKWKRAWRIKTRKHESKLSYTLYLISTCFFMCKMKLDLQYEPQFLVLFVNMIEEILRREMGNFTMKFLSLSWQASICLANLPTCSLYSFLLSFVFFVLEKVIYSLTQWHESPIYSRCYRGVWYEVSL